MELRLMFLLLIFIRLILTVSMVALAMRTEGYAHYMLHFLERFKSLPSSAKVPLCAVNQPSVRTDNIPSRQQSSAVLLSLSTCSVSSMLSRLLSAGAHPLEAVGVRVLAAD